jgi:hypothetical protein
MLIRIILLPLALLLGIIDSSYGETPAENYNKHSNDQDSAIGAVHLKSGKDTKAAQNHKENADEMTLNWLSDVKPTDLLIAIFTGVLAWKTSGLFNETRKLRETANDQRMDMLRSIQAAEKSAAIAERALTELEGPFVVVDIIKSGLDFGSEDTATLEYVFRNYGRTPASILEIYSNIAFIDVNSKVFHPIDRSSVRGDPMPYGIIAPPGGITLNTFKEKISKKGFGDQQFNVSSPSKSCHFFGFVVYSDIFGQIYTTGFKLQARLHRKGWDFMGD